MGLASLVLCVFVMSDDEMLAPPSEAIHRPGEPYTRNRMVFAQGSHDQLPDEDGDIEQPFAGEFVSRREGGPQSQAPVTGVDGICR